MAAHGELRGEQHAYATLLLNDTYLPGALVLAHSLRDAGTTKPLAVLVTLDTVSVDVITQLKSVFDYIIPVPRIRNANPANLELMNRTDLHSAFTKINLWNQTQFSKIVYIDADVVAYRAPDELFAIPHDFSAAPDIGWPDLFNSGVMVLKPNLADYYALLAMAEKGISFDGADQGLLNMYFKNDYNRLSFTYNVTPSAHYQYVPAYRQFQSSINMVHFIGPDKPWFRGRQTSSDGSAFNDMVTRWWAVYDKHYRAQETVDTSKDWQVSLTPLPPQQTELVKYFVKGEFQPSAPRDVLTGEQRPSELFSGTTPAAIPYQHHQHHHVPFPTSSESPPESAHGHRHDHRGAAYEHRDQGHENRLDHAGPGGQSHHCHQEPHQGPGDQTPNAAGPLHSAAPLHFSASSNVLPPGAKAEAPKEQVYESRDEGSQPPPAPAAKPYEPPRMEPSWDAQRQPPPVDSKPEALNFPHQIYEMSQDTAPFVPPERYPSPPRDMWYEVPKEPPAPPTHAIFPWETHQPPPTRVFVGDDAKSEHGQEGERTSFEESSETKGSSNSTWGSVTENLYGIGSSVSAHVPEPTSPATTIATPVTPTADVLAADPWTSFTRINAWDDVPQIDRYVETLPWHRRVRSHLTGLSGGLGVRLAPGTGEDGYRGARQWRGGLKLTDFPSAAERPSLPVTPAPIHRHRVWGAGDDGEEESQLLPAAYGVPAQTDWDPVEQLQRLALKQADLIKETLENADSAGARRKTQRTAEPGVATTLGSATPVGQSAPTVLSPQPVKGTATTSKVRSLIESDVSSSSILQPSYTGPGAAWDRGEQFPSYETPALPTEEERDILDV